MVAKSCITLDGWNSKNNGINHLWTGAGFRNLILPLCSFKIDVFLRVFLKNLKICDLKINVSCEEAFINFHHISQNARPATQNDDNHVQIVRLPGKLELIFWKLGKSIAPATQNDFRHVTKHIWLSRSATPATRNEATQRLKPPKMTPSAELTSTAIRGSRERLRTVADG